MIFDANMDELHRSIVFIAIASHKTHDKGFIKTEQRTISCQRKEPITGGKAQGVIGNNQ